MPLRADPAEPPNRQAAYSVPARMLPRLAAAYQNWPQMQHHEPHRNFLLPGLQSRGRQAGRQGE